eukprot:scaffold2.g6845.t1
MHGQLGQPDFVFVGGHFLARDENVFTLFEGQAAGVDGGGLGPVALLAAAAAGPGPADGVLLPPAVVGPPGVGPVSERTILDELKGSDIGVLDRLPLAITPGRVRHVGSAAEQQQQQQQQQPFPRDDSPQRALRPARSPQPPASPQAAPAPAPHDNGRPGRAAAAAELPMHLPPKHVFTCAVGRNVASRARYFLHGSMDIALLLHQMARADGVELQLGGLLEQGLLEQQRWDQCCLRTRRTLRTARQRGDRSRGPGEERTRRMGSRRMLQTGALHDLLTSLRPHALAALRTCADKTTESGRNYAISSMQGWRKNHEDAHIAHRYSDDCHLFGVFDGHGGPEVARFCSKYLPAELQGLPEFVSGTYGESLVAAFHRMDERMRSPEGFAELEILRKAEAEEGEGGEDEGDDTYEMLRKLVAMQRAMGSGAPNGTAAGEEGASSRAAAAAAGASEEMADADGGGGGGVAAAPGGMAWSMGNGGGSGGAAPDPMLSVQAGCTAVVALIKGRRLWVANAGDSRAVLCRGGAAVAMSEDHKPAQATERARIVAAGGFLSEIGGITRVNGNLNLRRGRGAGPGGRRGRCRAIGDLRYKANAQLLPKDQIITAEPDVRATDVGPDDRFLVLACDGVWDVMTNQQVVDFVAERLDRGQGTTEIACELLDTCLASNPREARGRGCDNMTAVIVLLQH